MSTFEIANTAMWVALTTHQPKLFAEVSEREYTICIPPDDTLPHPPSKVPLDVLRWHILVPSKLFQNQYHALQNSKALIDLCGEDNELLCTSSAAWPSESMTLILRKDSITKAKRNQHIPVFFLQSSLLASSGNDRYLLSPAERVLKKGFGGMDNYTIQGAVELLNTIDDGDTFSQTTEALTVFRQSYVPMDGNEAELVERAQRLAAKVAHTWVETIPGRHRSRKLEQSVELAAHVFAHNQMYQKVFKQLLRLYRREDELVGLACRRLRGNDLESFGAELTSTSKDGSTREMSGSDLEEALEVVASINVNTSPSEKMHTMQCVLNAISACVPSQLRGQLTADALLPFLLYVIVHSPCVNLFSHCEYTDKLCHEFDSGELYYALTTFQAAVHYLKAEGEREGPEVDLSKPSVALRQTSFASSSHCSTATNISPWLGAVSAPIGLGPAGLLLSPQHRDRASSQSSREGAVGRGNGIGRSRDDANYASGLMPGHDLRRCSTGSSTPNNELESTTPAPTDSAAGYSPMPLPATETSSANIMPQKVSSFQVDLYDDVEDDGTERDPGSLPPQQEP